MASVQRVTADCCCSTVAKCRCHLLQLVAHTGAARLCRSHWDPRRSPHHLHNPTISRIKRRHCWKPLLDVSFCIRLPASLCLMTRDNLYFQISLSHLQPACSGFSSALFDQMSPAHKRSLWELCEEPVLLCSSCPRVCVCVKVKTTGWQLDYSSFFHLSLQCWAFLNFLIFQGNAF